MGNAAVGTKGNFKVTADKPGLSGVHRCRNCVFIKNIQVGGIMESYRVIRDYVSLYGESWLFDFFMNQILVWFDF